MNCAYLSDVQTVQFVRNRKCMKHLKVNAFYCGSALRAAIQASMAHSCHPIAPWAVWLSLNGRGKLGLNRFE